MDNEEFEKWAKTIAKEHANWFNISINLETEEAEIDSSARDLLQKAFLAGATLSKSVASETIVDWDKVPDAKRKILLKDPNTYLRMNVKDFAEIIKASDRQTAKEIFNDLDKLLKKEYISKESSNYLALKAKHLKVD